MSNYLLIYSGVGWDILPSSAKEQARDAWSSWFQQLGSAVVDRGNPVGGGQAKTISDEGNVTDPPFTITGYSILQAESFEAAVSLAKSCPLLSSSGQVSVVELVPEM